MKIAIYGVSRSGKNFMIEKLVKQLGNNAFHLNGSLTLNKMAANRFNCSFKELCEREKSYLRKEFTRIIDSKDAQYKYVFVDGHYAFMDTDEYKVVFTSEDKFIYDAFFYLDTPSNMIIQFFRNSKGDKKNTLITEREIEKWKQFEINEMSELCKQVNKDFIILNNEVNISIEFLKKYITDKGDEDKRTRKQN
ncbi:MAG: AAA family ATPase [Marinifilaceae bacterium]